MRESRRWFLRGVLGAVVGAVAAPFVARASGFVTSGLRPEFVRVYFEKMPELRIDGVDSNRLVSNFSYFRCGGHASDCAVHNEPAMPAGPCDCERV